MNCQQSFQQIADKSVDYIISALYIILQITALEEFDFFQFIDISLIVASLISQVICKKKYFGIQQDFSPLFFWILALIRNYMITKFENKLSLLLVYVIGFSHGHYSSSIQLQNMNQALFSGKAISQYLLIFALVISNQDGPIDSTILLLIILVLIIYQNFRKNCQMLQDQQKQSQAQNDLSQISRSFNRLLVNDVPNQQVNNNSDLQRPSSPSQLEFSAIKMDKQMSIKVPEQQFDWQNVIEQSEDYICRFTLNLNMIDGNIENAQKNYSLCKFLQDQKLNLIQLLKEIKVSNDLNISVCNSINLDEQSKSLYNWITSTLNEERVLEIQKQKQQLQPFSLNENLNISSPGVQKSIKIDPFLEKSFSGISVIPLVQGSLEVSNLRNRIALYGKFQNQKQIFYLYILISLFQEEKDGEGQNIALILRDLDKQVRQIKSNQKNIEKINTTIKFIQQQASLISQIHKRILMQQNQIEQSRSRQATQLVKRTSSVCSYKDSVDDNLSDISEKCSKNQQLQQFINKLQFQFIKITQNNFNYIEVYSENDLVDLDKKKVDITQTINLLLNQFHYDEIVISQKINLILKDIDLFSRQIITDTRRLKQLFFNLIDNAIKAYEFEQEYVGQRNVVVAIKNYEDDFHIEIIDNGVGLCEQDVGAQRLLQCKLGLAASQKLLRQLGGVNKQLTIIRFQRLHETVVKFELPKILLEDRTLNLEEFEFDTIKFVYNTF